MLPNKRLSQAAGLTALLFAMGCASTTEVTKTEPKAPVKPTVEASEPIVKSEPAPTLEPMYFDTDQAVLKSEARVALRSYAKAILDHPEWGVVTIEGHCDERGSDRHNQALGRRRAAAVEQYLVELGVPRARLATLSFGAEKPAVSGHDERAWRYNRRSELQVELLAAASF